MLQCYSNYGMVTFNRGKDTILLVSSSLNQKLDMFNRFCLEIVNLEIDQVGEMVLIF